MNILAEESFMDRLGETVETHYGQTSSVKLRKLELEMDDDDYNRCFHTNNDEHMLCRMHMDCAEELSE